MITKRVIAAVTTLALIASCAAQEMIRLEPVTSGMRKRVGGVPGRVIKLSTTKPASIKTSPAELKWPLYGTLLVGAKDAPYAFPLILDSDRPDAPRSRLWIDADRNGNLTDDPAVEWKLKEEGEPTSEKNYIGSVVLDI